MQMNPFIKAQFQKINFFLGRNPRLVKRNDWQNYIPKPYNSVVLISADFELAWAWRYVKNCIHPMEKALSMANRERENIPEILRIAECFDIPISWITVGHLFLHECSKINGIPHHDILRPDHFVNDWWEYNGNDWFEHDPCSNVISDPLWYSPDLIEMILKSKVRHEIGCHTFSHIDCRDQVCSPEQFRSEIDACKKAAEKLGISNMTSFVHPGHTIGNLETLVKSGFTNFRTDYENTLGYPVRHSNGLWELSTTLEFEFKSGWSVDSQIKRYISVLKRGIRNHSVVYFWFHPSIEKAFISEIMPEIFSWLHDNRNEVIPMNSGEFVNFLNNSTF